MWVVPGIAGTLNGRARLVAASPWSHGGGTVQQEGARKEEEKRGEERREDINFCLTLAATSPYNGMAHCNKSNLLSLQANLI